LDVVNLGDIELLVIKITVEIQIVSLFSFISNREVILILFFSPFDYFIFAFGY
jgi:hypothetical protein